MATGDLAASAGLAVFPDSQDRRLGYENDNVRGDELADHMINGGHPWSKIAGKPTAFPPTNHGHSWTEINVPGLGSLDGYLAGMNAAIAGKVDATAVAAKRDATDGAFGGTPIYTPHGRANQVTTSYVAAYLNADGRIGASPSSARYKTNITPLTVDVSDVLAIEPVEFDRVGGGHEVGLIAEQVHEHVPQIVVWTADQIDGVHYHLLPVLLLRVAQEQQQQIADLTARITELEAS